MQVHSIRVEDVRRFATDFMDRFGICMVQDAAIEDVLIHPHLSTDELRKFRVYRSGSAVWESGGTAVSDDCDDLITDLSDAGGWLEVRDASDDVSMPSRNVAAVAGGSIAFMPGVHPVIPPAPPSASARLCFRSSDSRTALVLSIGFFSESRSEC